MLFESIRNNRRTGGVLAQEQQQRSCSPATTLLAAAASSSSSSAGAASSSSSSLSQRIQPIPVPDETNLYYIPSDLSPTYRPVPWTVQAAVWLLSAAISAVTTAIGSSSTTLTAAQWRTVTKKLVWFLFQTALLAVASTLVVQDVRYAPSRVTVDTLLRRYFLPSRISQFRRVDVPDREIPRRVLPSSSSESSSTSSINNNGEAKESSSTTTTPVGVHFLENVLDGLEKDGTGKSSPPAFRAMHVNHGFGASSLSWLPALAPLQRALRIPVAIGHDAVGFGFTERKKDRLGTFTSKASAAIGLELLKPYGDSAAKTGSSQSLPNKLLLMGHSMGAITTLRMALGLKDAPKHVVLVAPALGIRNQKKVPVDTGATNSSRSIRRVASRYGRWLVRCCCFLPQTIFDIAAVYILRRVVGAKDSWRNGLKQVWGDPDRLSDSDVLRFQWPSIGAGWERGLLSFSRAQSLPTDLTDRELVENVLKLSNTSVSVIVGTKDIVVPTETVFRFLKDFPTVRIVELDGLGHDPFEEDTESFVQAVKEVTEES